MPMNVNWRTFSLNVSIIGAQVMDIASAAKNMMSVTRKTFDSRVSFS